MQSFEEEPETFGEFAQNGDGATDEIGECLQVLEPSQSGICASEELAQNGLLPVSEIGEPFETIEPHQSAPCAAEELTRADGFDEAMFEFETAGVEDYSLAAEISGEEPQHAPAEVLAFSERPGIIPPLDDR